MFPFTGYLPPGVGVLIAALAIGIAAGMAASALSSALYRIEDAFHRLPIHWMWWPALGAVVVGVGGLVDPHALGPGYDNIQSLLDGSIVLRAVLLLLVVKAIVWLVALGSGTSGGILAPLLMLGGALGAVAGHWLPGSDGGWALVGMAAMMSAAMRAPLTAAIFAVELSGRLDALPAAAAASVTGYAVAVLVLRCSILTEKIARRGRHLNQEYVVDPLSLVRVGEIMTVAPDTLTADMPLAAASAFFATAKHRSYPVVDAPAAPSGSSRAPTSP